MIQIALKNILMFSLPLLAFTSHANYVSDRNALANQCLELSHKIYDLGSSQNEKICRDKLTNASIGIENAIMHFIYEELHEAKQEFDISIDALAYAELNGCTPYNQIIQYKAEVQSIKNSL